MESLQNFFVSSQLIAWAIVLLVILLLFKFFKSAGKSLIYLVIILLLLAALQFFFPEFVDSVFEFFAAFRSDPESA